eukprot:5737431-Prymnesium_polylepis.1
MCSGLWPMMRPEAVTDAKRALRVPGWHNDSSTWVRTLSVHPPLDGLWPMLRLVAVTGATRALRAAVPWLARGTRRG